MIANFSEEATPEVGSSISSSRGFSASATAISTSLRLPSGNSPALRSATSRMLTRSSRFSMSARSGRSCSGRISEVRPLCPAAAINRFSITVWSRNNCGIWNARAIPKRVMSRGRCAVISRPRNRTVPACGFK